MKIVSGGSEGDSVFMELGGQVWGLGHRNNGNLYGHKRKKDYKPKPATH
jgi:hypothetical protein